MNQVNFLPWREMQMQRWQRRWLAVLLCQMAFFLCTGLIFFLLLNRQHRDLQHQQADLQQQYTKLQRQQADYRSKQQQQTQLSDHLARAASGYEQSRQRHLRLMELAKWTPEQVWITGVIDAEGFSLEGYSRDYASIISLQTQLRNYPDFSAVELDSVSDSGESGMLRFSLSAKRRK